MVNKTKVLTEKMESEFQLRVEICDWEVNISYPDGSWMIDKSSDICIGNEGRIGSVTGKVASDEEDLSCDRKIRQKIGEISEKQHVRL